MKLTKIISGGQTGADRGGLEAGLALGLCIGGFCPQGRRSEDGTIPQKYPLEETASSGYTDRTEANVQAADATVVFTRGPLTPGSKATLWYARTRPHIHIDLRNRYARSKFLNWFRQVDPEVLNVAGSRESKGIGLQKAVEDFLDDALSEVLDLD